MASSRLVLAALLFASSAAAGCAQQKAGSLTMYASDRPVATHAALDVGYERLIGSNATCPVPKSEGIHIQGGSIDTCRYDRDPLDLVSSSCDDYACSFDPAPGPGLVRVRALRPGPITVHVKARSRNDGDTLDGSTTFTAMDAATVGLSSRKSTIDEPLPLELDQFPLATGMTLSHEIVARAADGTELYGLPEAKGSDNVTATIDASALITTANGVGKASVDVTVGDAKASLALTIVDVGDAHTELHAVHGDTIAPEADDVVALTLTNGAAWDVPRVTCARTADGTLAIVAAPALELRGASEGSFFDVTVAEPGIVGVSALERGTAELWAPGYRVAKLTAE